MKHEAAVMFEQLLCFAASSFCLPVCLCVGSSHLQLRQRWPDEEMDRQEKDRISGMRRVKDEGIILAHLQQAP